MSKAQELQKIQQLVNPINFTTTNHNKEETTTANNEQEVRQIDNKEEEKTQDASIKLYQTEIELANYIYLFKTSNNGATLTGEIRGGIDVTSNELKATVYSGNVLANQKSGLSGSYSPSYYQITLFQGTQEEANTKWKAATEGANAINTQHLSYNTFSHNPNSVTGTLCRVMGLHIPDKIEINAVGIQHNLLANPEYSYLQQPNHDVTYDTDLTGNNHDICCIML